MIESAVIDFPSIESAIALVGDREANLKLLMQQTGANVVLRGQQLCISGTQTQVRRCRAIVSTLAPLWEEGRAVSGVDLEAAKHAIDTQQEARLTQLHQDVLAQTRQGRSICAKTLRQAAYVKAVRSHSLTFCIGPAGTGKTFLATVLAVQALLAEEVQRLILTRPAVEAGERLGFLPGDLQQKIDPYLRPLYDALHELVEPERISNLMERGVIEVAPLAYMRGRTLSNAFVILDEAQNTTPAQMKMLLTRLGMHSRMVVTGDITQTDLPQQQQSGLVNAQSILREVEGIAFCQLSRADVVRNPLVQKIVSAYETHESQASTKPKSFIRGTSVTRSK